MSLDGSHCKACGIGMIVGGYCNNSKCPESPSYTPGGKKKSVKDRNSAQTPKEKWGWFQYGIMLAVILIIIAVITE